MNEVTSVEFDKEAMILGRKMPIPLSIFLFVSIPVVLAGIYTTIFVTNQIDVALLIAFLGGGPLLYLFLNDRGYQIVWDAERIYMRNWGFKNIFLQRPDYHGMSYDEIASIEGRYQGNAAAKSKFMPFEYLELQSHDADVEDIWIYPLSLKDEDLRPLLMHLQEKCPDIFPEVVSELLANNAKLT